MNVAAVHEFVRIICHCQIITREEKEMPHGNRRYRFDLAVIGVLLCYPQICKIKCFKSWIMDLNEPGTVRLRIKQDLRNEYLIKGGQDR